MATLTASHKNLYKLVLQAYDKGQLTKQDRETFRRDHKQYERKELTFRELLESIRQPTGELKKAMEEHYSTSAYKRVFKNQK